MIRPLDVVFREISDFPLAFHRYQIFLFGLFWFRGMLICFNQSACIHSLAALSAFNTPFNGSFKHSV